MDPTKLNRQLLREMVDKYGYADIRAELDKPDGWPLEEDFLTGGVPLDDYVHCKITQKQHWIDLYATPYYFGCEADDRMNAVAFGKAMPLGARINAVYRSDIGHFDVVAVQLWGTQNPHFFDGTAVAREAAVVLNASAPGLPKTAK